MNISPDFPHWARRYVYSAHIELWTVPNPNYIDLGAKGPHRDFHELILLRLISATEKFMRLTAVLVCYAAETPPPGLGDDLPLIGYLPCAGHWLNIFQCGTALV